MGALEIRATTASLAGDTFQVTIMGLWDRPTTVTYVGSDGHAVQVADEHVSRVETPVGDWITAPVSEDHSGVTFLSVLMPVVGGLAGFYQAIAVSTVAVETIQESWYDPGFPRSQAGSYTTRALSGNAFVAGKAHSDTEGQS